MWGSVLGLPVGAGGGEDPPISTSGYSTPWLRFLRAHVLQLSCAQFSRHSNVVGRSLSTAKSQLRS